MNENEFFREAAKRICGTLEIDEGLFDLHKLLRTMMPVKMIYLQYYEAKFNSMCSIAMVSETEYRKTDILVHLSKESENLADNTPKDRDVFLMDDPQKFPISQEMSSYHDIKPSTLIILALRIQGELLGFLVLTTEGEDTFKNEHLKWIDLLKEPLVIAMSNARKHMEVTKYNDLLADNNRYLHGELRRVSGEKIIGADFGLKEVMFKVQQVAQMGSPVLLLGETGTGKDVIANAIHYSSLRNKEPFVSVNCGAIPDTLIDSELFGHEKGAFTGALSQKRGRFERADKGTIFLDEIGELPLQAQVRLLRVLQSKEIERVGGSKTIKLDIRIIAATNRDMKQMVKDKLFREDLWFRLNVFPILIPPLRERKSDIPALVQYFIHEKSKELKLPTIPELAQDAMDSLLNYDWPGNVRELDNIIERALILQPKGPISFDQMGFDTQQDFDDSTVILDEVVANHIRKILKQTKGKINGRDGTAAMLGVNPNTLRNRMIKLGIEYGRAKN
jgi:formate hydrogenlyase transcriptional activator